MKRFTDVITRHVGWLKDALDSHELKRAHEVSKYELVDTSDIMSEWSQQCYLCSRLDKPISADHDSGEVRHDGASSEANFVDASNFGGVHCVHR